MFSGIDVRKSGGSLLIDAFLQDGGNPSAEVTTGTTTVYVDEVQSDGTLKSFDFHTNAFVAANVSPVNPTSTLAHQTRNNGATSTGYWTAVLTTLTGFTVGNTYVVHVNNSGASPPDQARKFVYGGADGDLALDSAGRVNLVSALNAAAVTAIQNGLATSSQAAAILSAFNSLNNLSKRMNIIVPATMVYEPASPISYPCAVNVFDQNGVLADLDASALPTLTVTNAAGTSRAANLSSITHPSVGNYRFTYTPATGDPQQEGLLFTSAGTQNSESLSGAASAAVSSIDYLSTLSAIEAQTNKIGTSAGDSTNAVTAQNNAATAATQATAAANSCLTTTHFNTVLGTPAASVSADIAAVKADTHATLQIEQGDEYIDGSTTPWNWVLMVNGAGAPTPGGGSNELLRKKLKTVTGGAITDTLTVVGQKESA